MVQPFLLLRLWQDDVVLCHDVIERQVRLATLCRALGDLLAEGRYAILDRDRRLTTRLSVRTASAERVVMPLALTLSEALLPLLQEGLVDALFLERATHTELLARALLVVEAPHLTSVDTYDLSALRAFEEDLAPCMATRVGTEAVDGDLGTCGGFGILKHGIHIEGMSVGVGRDEELRSIGGGEGGSCRRSSVHSRCLVLNES